MNRIPVVTATVFVASAIALTACEQRDGAGGPNAPGQTAPEAEVLIPDDVHVPSAEEAAAEAEGAINADNADAAFEELTREIEADDAEDD